MLIDAAQENLLLLRVNDGERMWFLECSDGEVNSNLNVGQN